MLLLVGGHARSGTTLLRHLCNDHREMAVTNELNFLSGLGSGYLGHSRVLLGRVWQRTQQGIRWGDGLGPGARAAKFAVRYLRALRTNNEGVVDVPAVERAMRAVFADARVVGDKTPHYGLLLERVVGLSGLTSLIIFRDCRDVVSSFLERVRTAWHTQSWTRDANSAERVALRWVRYVELMERHRGQIVTVRYEDLVRRPRPVLDQLAAALEIDPAGFSVERLASVQDTSIGKHRSGLTREELAVVLDIAGPAMARLGYA